MDANTVAIVAAIVGVGVALTGLGVTVLILLLRGFFRLGQLFQRIDAQDENIRQIREDMRQSNSELREDMRQSNSELREDMRIMREDIQRLTTEMRRTNETVTALANHRHDQDGNIVFILPAQSSG